MPISFTSRKPLKPAAMQASNRAFSVLMESKPGSKYLFLSTSYPKTGLILSLSKDPLFGKCSSGLVLFGDGCGYARSMPDISNIEPLSNLEWTEIFKPLVSASFLTMFRPSPSPLELWPDL